MYHPELSGDVLSFFFLFLLKSVSETIWQLGETANGEK